MSIDLGEHADDLRDELRIESVPTRVRAWSGGRLCADTRAALQVWQVRRYLSDFWIPDADLHVELTEPLAPAPDPGELPRRLFPNVPFAVHLQPGTDYDVTLDGGVLPRAAFRPDDERLRGGVILDFDAFDRWAQEDGDVIGHPRDPYHRIDVYPSTQHVVVRRGDTVLADTTRAQALVETGIPVRWYVPREDVRMDALTRSDTTSICTYKGVASYFAVDGTDVAWTYEHPLTDAVPVHDALAFLEGGPSGGVTIDVG